MVASRVASSWVWALTTWASTVGSSPTGGWGPTGAAAGARQVAAAAVGVAAAERSQLGLVEGAAAWGVGNSAKKARVILEASRKNSWVAPGQ